MIINSIEVREYLTDDGKNPYREWLLTLPVQVRARIQARIYRVSRGNIGDYKSVGGGVPELRIFTGPGYRVYFGWQGFGW